jgi:hypothetical protein
MVAVDESGAPASSAGTSLVSGFQGAGMVIATNRRLVGSLLQGESSLGRIDASRRSLFYSLPLEEVADITVMRKRKTFGGMRETGVLLGAANGGALFVDLDRAVTDSRRSVAASRLDAAKSMVQAAGAIQRAFASEADGRAIDKAVGGEWVAEDDDLIAKLRADDDAAVRVGSIVRHGGAARTSGCFSGSLTSIARDVPDAQHADDAAGADEPGGDRHREPEAR